MKSETTRRRISILCLSFAVVPHFLNQAKSKAKNDISSALIIVTVIEISVAIGRSFFTDFPFFILQKSSSSLTRKLIPLQSAAMDIYPLEIRELYHRKNQNEGLLNGLDSSGFTAQSLAVTRGQSDEGGLHGVFRGCCH